MEVSKKLPLLVKQQTSAFSKTHKRQSKTKTISIFTRRLTRPRRLKIEHATLDMKWNY